MTAKDLIILVIKKDLELKLHAEPVQILEFLRRVIMHSPFSAHPAGL